MGNNAPQSKQIDPGSLEAGEAIHAADRDAGWPAADWWRVYRDPQLDAWIAAALAGNPTLAAAQARVREAQAMVRIAHSTELPQINGNLSLMRQQWPTNQFYGPGIIADANDWNNTGTLNLSYHLDLWSKDKNATERALDVAHATSADARAARLEIEVNVVRTYISLSMNYALLDLAHDTLKRQEGLADLARKRLKGGIGTQLDVSQAEATLPDFERQIDTYEEGVELARHQLAALAGKGPGAGDSIGRPKLVLNGPGGLPSTMPAELIGRRPDVVAARWLVDAQARGIEVAKADFYPNVNLLATVGGFGVTQPFAGFLRAMNGGYSFGPAISLPIFVGGRLRAQLGAAAAGYDQAVEHYNQTILRALKDISDLVVRTKSIETQKEDAARSVAINQRTYQLSREGFRRGLTDYVNVLIAQQQLLRAQDTAARIDAERLTIHALLIAALGGGVGTGDDMSKDQPSAGRSAGADASSGAKPEHAAPAAQVASPTKAAAAAPASVPAVK